jgi:hypothetical protein
MNAVEARRRRRARRRGLLAIALVGSAGVAGVVMTFVPWIHGPTHQAVTGWELFHRFGVVLHAYEDDDAFYVFTGITTLVGGALLAAGAMVLAVMFDPEVRGDFGFLAFADWVVTPVRVLAAVAATILVLTGATHLLIGLTWTGLASLVLALLGEVGVSVVTLPRTV